MQHRINSGWIKRRKMCIEPQKGDLYDERKSIQICGETRGGFQHRKLADYKTSREKVGSSRIEYAKTDKWIYRNGAIGRSLK